MPLYEYYCHTCGSKFERLRPMSSASKPVRCPEGHPGAGRVVSVFAAHTKEASGPAAALAQGGGCPGCAGGSCACAG